MIRFSTAVTPGADQAARSASSRSAQERTIPFRPTLLSCTSTAIRCASSSALRTSASSILLLRSDDVGRGLTAMRLLTPPDARQAVDDPFGVLLLVLPLYIAFERDPSVRDGHLEVLHRYEGVRLERANDGRGDVRIGPLGGARKPDLELVDHRLHAVDSMDGFLGGPALAVRIDPAIERDSPVLDGHADFAGLNAAIPFQLCQHVVPDLVVGRAHGFGGGCHARSPFNQSGCGAVPPPGEDRVEEAEAL